MENKIEPRDEKPEDFYGQPDSAYVRIQYDPLVNGFKFYVRNEIYHALEDASQVDDHIKALSALTRGLVEAGLVYAADIYHLGLKAQAVDYMLLNTQEIENKEHREMLLGEPSGIA